MNEGPINPFESPLFTSEGPSVPGRARRLAGIIAYLFAGYLAFAGTTMVLMRLAGYGSEGVPVTSIFSLATATLLGWAGYRLRHRPRGIVEWLVFALFLSMVINTVVVLIVLFSQRAA